MNCEYETQDSIFVPENSVSSKFVLAYRNTNTATVEKQVEVVVPGVPRDFQLQWLFTVVFEMPIGIPYESVSDDEPKETITFTPEGGSSDFVVSSKWTGGVQEYRAYPSIVEDSVVGMSEDEIKRVKIKSHQTIVISLFKF
ncbi:hypothetical protein FACS1894125_2330 [Actinomycetota bacterium]|nr:hypothetical protein FACS1894125_2330 [Actinomycetota bacterium]